MGLTDTSDTTLYEDRSEPGMLHLTDVPGWVHTTQRTPFANLVGLLLCLQDPETGDYSHSDRAIGDFAYRYIAGYGPDSLSEALPRAKQRIETGRIDCMNALRKANRKLQDGDYGTGGTE